MSSNLAGGIVKVGAYDTELWATPAQARRAFFKGRCVLILEPFFKRGLDGLCFIRVDQRDDIIVDIPDPRPEPRHRCGVALAGKRILHSLTPQRLLAPRCH